MYRHIEKDEKKLTDEEIVKYIEKLQKQVKEYQDKIENGTLVELPCKVGDKVYVIYRYEDWFGKIDEPFIEEDIVKFFMIENCEIKIIPSNWNERHEEWFTVKDICFNLEEAEKRLEELKK